MKVDRESYGSAFAVTTDADAMAFLFKRAGYDRQHERDEKSKLTADELAERVAHADSGVDRKILHGAIKDVRARARFLEGIARDMESISALLFDEPITPAPDPTTS